jgi:branched-chain amino acid transport system permease protein
MDAVLSLPFWWLVLTFTGINAVFVMGLNVQAGETGLLNFGHVAFMAIGGYSFGLMVTNGVTIALALPLALLTGAALGIVLGIPTLRLRGDYFAITTIAAGEILRLILLNESDTTGGPRGLVSASGPWRDFNRDVVGWFSDTLGWEIDRRLPLLVLVWAVVLLVGVFLWYVTRSPWGRVLRAVRENEHAAAAVGKPVFSFKLQALALGGAIGALSGVLFAFASTTLYPENFLPIVTFTGFAILILGGMGSIIGTVVASVIITFLVDGSVLIDLPIDPAKVASLRYVLIGLVIMLIMAYRPQGLFGKKEELHLGD